MKSYLKLNVSFYQRVDCCIYKRETNIGNNYVRYCVTFWTNELWKFPSKLLLTINVSFSITVDYLYLEEIIINIAKKYVSIYVSIESTGHESQQWSYTWHSILASI